MKELEIMAKKDLLKIYKKILLSRDFKLVQEDARNVYNEYVPGIHLISDEIMIYVGKLFPIAYPNSKMESNTLTFDEIKEIIKNLEK